jgi:aspartyl-tRNA synthetase
MVSGFDRYFQIAPCFRDEDGRADRTPGEFYQLDLEMSFVTQEDIFAVIEPVTYNIFEEFSDFTGKKKTVSPYPFKRIPFKESMKIYGTDKPDLRNPLIINDLTEVFTADNMEFKAFKSIAENGGVVRGIKVSNIADKPRSFFDKLNDWAQEEAQPGLGYLIFAEGTVKGALKNFFNESAQAKLKEITGAADGDAIFFIANKKEADANKFAGLARTKIAKELDLIDTSRFEICWIVDFPMYEFNEEKQKVDFSHNPFSMPQDDLKNLGDKNPLDVLAYQYDLVINGYETASGGMRNSSPEIMEKAFEIAGYDKSVLLEKFAGLYSAFKFGAPPHGGAGLGIDRIIMILAEEESIREIIAFPMNQKAQDLLMQAPNKVDESQLKELYLKLDLPLDISEEK